MNTRIKRFNCILIILLFICFGCETDKNQVIEIATHSMEIQTVDSIPFGWNTFSYKNQSHETHFIAFEKYSNGKFHSVMGMFKEVRVTDHESEKGKPQSTIDLSISSQNGITANTSYKAGNQIIAVPFTDQKVHEHFLGHDVQLVKLNDEANLKELDNWMNWTNPKGFISPPQKESHF